MLNRQLNREIEHHMPNPLYLLWSKESFFLEEALASIQEAVLSQEQRDFNYDVFDPSSAPQDILDTSLSFPLLARRRLVILKDFHQLKSSHIKVLTTYLQKPSETTCMVILSQKEPASKIKAVWRIYNLNLHEKDIPLWIKKKATEKGLSISEGAVDLLIDWHYKQFYMLWENKGKRPPRMKTSTLRALSQYLPSFTEKHFRDIFQYLHETDVRIKTSGRPELALEVLLIKLLQAGTGS
jgi:DNA polymerase III delta subunit